MRGPINRAALALGLALVASIAGNVATVAALIEERSLPPLASPQTLSIRFMREADALDFWQEALSLGEGVCLTTLEGQGLPYWLHTCAQPSRATAKPCGDSLCYEYGAPLDLSAPIRGDEQ